MVSGITDIWISIIRNHFQMLGLDESKPRGIIVLGILLGLGALAQLAFAFAGDTLYVLGHSLQAVFAIYAYLLYVLVSLSLAYGFLKLKKAAYYLAILWFLWGATNGIFNYLMLADFEVLVDGALSIVFLAYIYSKKEYFVN